VQEVQIELCQSSEKWICDKTYRSVYWKHFFQYGDYFNTLGMGDADVRFLHTSQFMLSLLSVGDVRNYLNVWSGSIMFSPPTCLNGARVAQSVQCRTTDWMTRV
jgi:hypothetical protein